MRLAALRATLLSLVLLGRAALAREPRVPSHNLRIELRAEPLAGAHRVAVAAGEVTVLRFDAELWREGVTWEGRFVLVEVGARSITLVPALDWREDEPLRLTVRFRDGAAPESVTFLLVEGVESSARQVEVYRFARPVESYRRQVAEEQEKARRCLEDNARLRATCRGSEGLTGLFANEELGLQGVTSTHFELLQAQAAGEVFHFGKAFSLRSRQRVAVGVELQHTGKDSPWEAASAVLVGEDGEVLEATVWQRAPISPGETGWVFVELRAGGTEARGTYTLRLREASGARTVTLGKVRFP